MELWILFNLPFLAAVTLSRGGVQDRVGVKDLQFTTCLFEHHSS